MAPDGPFATISARARFSKQVNTSLRRNKCRIEEIERERVREVFTKPNCSSNKGAKKYIRLQVEIDTIYTHFGFSCRTDTQAQRDSLILLEGKERKKPNRTPFFFLAQLFVFNQWHCCFFDSRTAS